jgi:probable O-glycosylation ligase (exosortase A-associated)
LHRADRRSPELIRHTHRLTASHLAFAAFAFWILVTYVTAQNKAAADVWIEEYLKIFLMYFVSAFLIRSVKQVWALFVMVGLALAYICYEINFLYLVNGYLGIQKNGYGGLDNNGAGLMLAMGAPVCWFCFEGTKRWWRWGFIVLLPVIVHAVLMTYSRGAMLSLIVACPVMILRSRFRLRLAAGLIVGAFMLLPLLAGKEIRERFLSIEQNEVDDSANSRRQSWAAAYRIAQDYPVFGVGVRNANLFSQAYGADMEGRTIHSQYLQILADNGFPGLALYLLVLGSSLLSLRRVRLLARVRDDDETRLAVAVANGLESSLLTFCFGALFLSLEVFELPFLLLLMCAQLALVSGACEPEATEPVEEAKEETSEGDEAEAEEPAQTVT